MKALQRDPALRYASAAEMARDLDEFVVGASFHVDERGPLPSRGRAAPERASPFNRGAEASSVGTMTTEAAARTTKVDLVHRLRMSRLGRLLFGRWKQQFAAEPPMKLFVCASCQQVVYFENSQCTRCGHALAYLPDARRPRRHRAGRG